MPPLGCWGNLTFKTVQPVFTIRVTVKDHLRQSGLEAFHHLLLQTPDVRFVGRHVRMGNVKCTGQPDDACHIFCAASKHALLPPPTIIPSMRMVGHVQETSSLGSVKFVRTASEIHIQFCEVHGVMPHGLNGVAVEVRPMLPAERTDFDQVDHDTHFIVGMHERNQGLGFRRLQDVGQRIEINAAVSVVAHMHDFNVVHFAHRIRGLDDCAVLCRRSHDARDPETSDRGLNGVVVGFRAPEVKQIVRGGTFNSSAMRRRLVSTKALALRPGACVDDGLPNTDRCTSIMASATSGATGVVAALSR